MEQTMGLLKTPFEILRDNICSLKKELNALNRTWNKVNVDSTLEEIITRIQKETKQCSKK